MARAKQASSMTFYGHDVTKATKATKVTKVTKVTKSRQKRKVGTKRRREDRRTGTRRSEGYMARARDRARQCQRQ
jgi:hypothetical protein